ncbi:hypothetical protein WME87_28785 [Sorangium sp. So ce1389]
MPVDEAGVLEAGERRVSPPSPALMIAGRVQDDALCPRDRVPHRPGLLALFPQPQHRFLNDVIEVPRGHPGIGHQTLHSVGWQADRHGSIHDNADDPGPVRQFRNRPSPRKKVRQGTHTLDKMLYVIDASSSHYLGGLDDDFRPPRT